MLKTERKEKVYTKIERISKQYWNHKGGNKGYVENHFVREQPKHVMLNIFVGTFNVTPIWVIDMNNKNNSLFLNYELKLVYN